MEINLPFSSCPLHSLTDLTRDLVTSDSFFFKISELKGPDSVGVDKRQEDTTTKSAGYHVSLLYNFESLFTAPHLMVVQPSVRLGWRPRPDQGTRWYSPITEVDRSHSLRHWHCWKCHLYASLFLSCTRHLNQWWLVLTQTLCPIKGKRKPQLNCLKYKEIYLICHFSPPIQLVDYITKHRYWFLCLLLLLLLPLWIGTLLSWPRTVNHSKIETFCHWIIPNPQITDYCTDQFTGIVGHGTNGLLCCLFYISFSFFSSLACFRDSIAMYIWLLTQLPCLSALISWGWMVVWAYISSHKF